MERLGARTFDLSDQHAFARLSGDFNPVHVDPVRARRDYFGGPVVHGIHTLLVGLDALAARLVERGAGAQALAFIRAEFPAPVPLDRVVETLLVEEPPEGPTRLEQRCDGVTVAKIRMEWTPRDRGEAGSDPIIEDAPFPPREPRDPAVDALSETDEETVLQVDRDLATRRFPHLMRLVSATDVAQILAVTRVVGMECPGLRSMLAALELRRQPGRAGPRLRYRVTRVDRRFSLVVLGLEGPTLQGEVRTFHRPEPVRQPTFAALRPGVPEGRFVGQKALVVGGSRGLGEVTAKLIAAGGGEVALTYRTGASDAARVRDEIGSERARAVALDVSDPGPAVEALADEGFEPTHLYYFATPTIFLKKGGLFDAEIFRTFVAIYVEGFHRTVRACRDRWDSPLTVFYPSTVALDERVRELAEYAAAKAAGEDLAEHLSRFEPGVQVVVDRLPRIATDQTTTLTPFPADRAPEALRPILDRLHPDTGITAG
ncbi:MAG: SDR family NAD(P)-dependent oxidoreductase [Gemmatimonadota bacterium]|jgi:NAD(P)-dependent dehydrogenase (short-subunit alcohol dehydrogenase family)